MGGQLDVEFNERTFAPENLEQLSGVAQLVEQHTVYVQVVGSCPIVTAIISRFQELVDRVLNRLGV